MSSNRVPLPSAAARQRVLLLVALVAVVTAWREREFARNRARFGVPHAPEPRP